MSKPKRMVESARGKTQPRRVTTAHNKPDTVGTNRPHVLMILESWGRGGTEAFVRELILWLQARGLAQVSLCLLVGDESVEQPAFQQLTGAVEKIHILGRRRSWATFRRLTALVRKEQPDICHSHLYSSLLPATVFAQITGARIVSTFHMPLDQWSLRHRIAWRSALQLSHTVTMGSRATESSFGRQLSRNKCYLTWPPLAPEWLRAEKPKRRGTSHETFNVMGVGRLTAEKEWSTLIRAAALLKERFNLKTRVLIRGEGPLVGSLQSLAHEKGIELELPGVAERGVLMEELMKADVFVLPSRFEGLGMAAVEAMALGVPTITADFEASADYVEHGVTGHTFPRGDAEALAELLYWHRNDPEDAAAIAKCGQTFVRKRFHPDNVFSELPGIYSKP